MDKFFAGPVFQVDHETFSWRDVVLFTHERGDWQDLLEEIQAGLAAVRHFAHLDDEALEERVDAAAAEFRYDRELITAEETEAWLRARGVTAAEWLASIRRTVYREHFADRLTGLGAAAGDEITEAIRVELRCTGLGHRLAEQCAEYAAVAAAIGRLTPSAAEAELPASLPPGLDPDHARTRLPLLAGMLEGAEEFRQAAITDEAIRREIQHHKMEWVRLECRALAFADPSPAREAALCLKDDGQSIEDVAASAHLEATDMRFYVDELDLALQPYFVSAMAGDVIGPSAVGESWTLFQVLSKTMPGESDPELRDRAAGRLFARALANEAQRRVHWLTVF